MGGEHTVECTDRELRSGTPEIYITKVSSIHQQKGSVFKLPHLHPPPAPPPPPEESLTLWVCKPNYLQRPADPVKGLGLWELCSWNALLREAEVKNANVTLPQLWCGSPPLLQIKCPWPPSPQVCKPSIERLAEEMEELLRWVRGCRVAWGCNGMGWG